MKASKKLIGAFVALIAALAISVGSTFAWFTTQNSAKVNSFDLSVQDATGNLYIGLDQNNLVQGNLTIDTSSSPWTNLKLKDVTTTDGKTFTDHKSGSATANSSYFALDLYFMSTTGVDVYLTTDSAVTCTVTADGRGTIGDNDLVLTPSVRETAGENYGDDLSETGKITTNAANAARVSFVEDGQSAVVWEPNNTTGYTGLNLAYDYEQYLTKGTWTVTQDEGLGTAQAKPMAATFAGTTNLVATTADSDAVSGKTKLFSLTANTVKKITINIWLEGKDGDCLNSIFNDKLSTVLSFVGVEAGD